MVNTNRKKNISTVIILAIVLLVPGFLYIGLNKIGSNEYLKLPIYGEKVLSGKFNRKMGREIADTTYHTIKPVNLIDSEGKKVTLFEQDSIISIVHLFYAKDKGLSNTMLFNLKNVAERFAQNKKIKFYSISIDTTDRGSVIEAIQQKYVGNSNPNWNILGSQGNFLEYARENFLIDAFQAPDDSTKFVFGNNYILVDPENRIRGFYDINLKTDIARLEDEIKVQIVEDIRNNPLKIEKK